MAVAARPGTSDARVPCPLCGGLIHPIAGKCKHCKADLASYHAARPAATTPLPALQARSAHANGHGGPAATMRAPASPVGAATSARDAAPPVLPPRPAARGYPVEPRPGAWRSWPVIAIAVAVLAIAGAIAAMAWPASAARPDGKRRLPPPPAPERMQTDPQRKPAPAPRAPVTPRSAQPDVTPAPPQEPAEPPPDRGAAVDPDDGGHDLDATDDALAGPGRGTSLALGTGSTIHFALMSHVCHKLMRCGNVNDVGVQGICEALAGMAIGPPSNCPAAQRCLARIDMMPCDAQASILGHINMLVTQLADCADAARC